jgi:hypothetical protein
MNCPHCDATTTKKRAKKTKLGYMTFFCSECRSSFNERTGTPFNYLEFPTDIVLLVVIWRLRYKLSLRDLAEMFLERGFTFTHEAIRDWEARFAPVLADQLRTRTTWASREILVCRRNLSHASMGSGVISIGLSTRMAIWLIRGFVRSEIWRQPSDFSSRLLLLLAMFPIKSQPMGISPIHGPFARQ